LAICFFGVFKSLLRRFSCKSFYVAIYIFLSLRKIVINGYFVFLLWKHNVILWSNQLFIFLFLISTLNFVITKLLYIIFTRYAILLFIYLTKELKVPSNLDKLILIVLCKIK
jgi:hypothetical protein